MTTHTTDCLCIFCAPISLPTKSPTLNHLLARQADCALAHALDRAHRMRVRQINQAALLSRCGVRAQGAQP